MLIHIVAHMYIERMSFSYSLYYCSSFKILFANLVSFWFFFKQLNIVKYYFYTI